MSPRNRRGAGERRSPPPAGSRPTLRASPGLQGGARPALPRLQAIDAARGTALCAMVAYHFCYDLRHFGLLAADFEHDPFWLAARALILSTFMALVGVSLVLSERNGRDAAHFWRRLAVVAAGAATVSLASLVVFPQSFIYFGVLHCIVIASLLTRPLLRRPGLALALGAAMVAIGSFVSHPAFDAPALSFVGLRTSKPQAEDYVPLLPWAGATLLGAAAAWYALTPRAMAALGRLRVPRLLSWMGRHSLAIYLAHQPLLFGLLWLFTSTRAHR